MKTSKKQAAVVKSTAAKVAPAKVERPSIIVNDDMARSFAKGSLKGAEAFRFNSLIYDGKATIYQMGKHFDLAHLIEGRLYVNTSPVSNRTVTERQRFVQYPHHVFSSKYQKGGYEGKDNRGQAIDASNIRERILYCAKQETAAIIERQAGMRKGSAVYNALEARREALKKTIDSLK